MKNDIELIREAADMLLASGQTGTTRDNLRALADRLEAAEKQEPYAYHVKAGDGWSGLFFTPTTLPHHENKPLYEKPFVHVANTKPTPAPVSVDQAMASELQSAIGIAKYMARKFYPTVTQWRPLDDMAGVLSQIDNMATGITQPNQQAELEALRKDLLGEKGLAGAYLNAALLADGKLDALQAELEALRKELDEWRFTNKIDELYRSEERLQAQLSAIRVAVGNAITFKTIDERGDGATVYRIKMESAEWQAILNAVQVQPEQKPETQAGIDSLINAGFAHIDHPMQHWDRTCPACARMDFGNCPDKSQPEQGDNP